MRTIVRIVSALLALAFLGCPGEARFKIAFQGTTKFEDDLKYECEDEKLKVKFGTNCYGDGTGWSVTLHVKLKNDREKAFYYDWSGSYVFVESAKHFAPDTLQMEIWDGQNRERRVSRGPIPRNDEWTFHITYQLDTWSSDPWQHFVHIVPGRILNDQSEVLCELPGVYGDPNNSFWTPFR